MLSKQELERIAQILKHKAEAETKVSDFYKECAKIWKEDSGFWMDMAGQEDKHSMNMIKILDMIKKHSDSVVINSDLKVIPLVIKLFIDSIKEDIEKIKENSSDKMIPHYFARAIEESIVENEYFDVVKTDKPEVLELVEEIRRQTIEHHDKINDRIKEFNHPATHNVDSNKKAADTDWPKEYIDPVLQIVQYHNRISEYDEFLRHIPEQLSEKKAWSELTRLENFFRKNLIQHFEYEEFYVFNELLARDNLPPSIRDTITTLRKEHVSMMESADEIIRFMYSHIYPLPKEKIEQLNIIIKEFLIVLKKHASIEDTDIFPLMMGK